MLILDEALESQIRASLHFSHIYLIYSVYFQVLKWPKKRDYATSSWSTLVVLLCTN